MTNLNKELDFDDISGKKIESPQKPISNEKTKVEILIPTGKNQWISKDLVDVTGKEFAAWAKGVFPIPLSNGDIERLNGSLAFRVQSFRNILQYHANSTFHLGRENKPNTTEH